MPSEPPGKPNNACLHNAGYDVSKLVLLVEAEASKSQLIGKHPDAAKDRGQKKGVTEDEIVGWHHRLDAHESEQALGDSEGQGSLECCSPRGRKELDMTYQLNNNN